MDAMEPERISAEELMRRVEGGEEFLFLDVRPKQSYRLSPVRIKGAVRVAPNDIGTRFSQLPANKPIVVYCSEPGDATAVRVVRILLDRGFRNVLVLRGGFDAWLRAGYPVEQKED